MVLADDRISWRPNHYQYQVWGSQTILEFPTVKLLDYEADWSSLETNPNPFAVMVMAHLKTQATRQKPTERLQWKIKVAKSLYQRGYSRQDILELFRLVNWMMTLPKELENSFNTELISYEEETKMPYITPLERFAIEKGRQEGLQEGLQEGRQEGRQEGSLESRREAVIDILTTRFQTVPATLVEVINNLADVAVLKTLLVQAVTIASIEEFNQAIAQQIDAASQ